MGRPEEASGSEPASLWAGGLDASDAHRRSRRRARGLAVRRVTRALSVADGRASSPTNLLPRPQELRAAEASPTLPRPRSTRGAARQPAVGRATAAAPLGRGSTVRASGASLSSSVVRFRGGGVEANRRQAAHISRRPLHWFTPSRDSRLATSPLALLQGHEPEHHRAGMGHLGLHLAERLDPAEVGRLRPPPLPGVTRPSCRSRTPDRLRCRWRPASSPNLLGLDPWSHHRGSSQVGAGSLPALHYVPDRLPVWTGSRLARVR